mmetsp:Transcript_28521/g.38039  ORF Transcript_28521/g.38039 Transcript_28521/m.38039 type:complete len:258 (+) Transcript_28521:47-820(+)
MDLRQGLKRCLGSPVSLRRLLSLFATRATNLLCLHDGFGLFENLLFDFFLLFSEVEAMFLTTVVQRLLLLDHLFGLLLFILGRLIAQLSRAPDTLGHLVRIVLDRLDSREDTCAHIVGVKEVLLLQILIVVVVLDHTHVLVVVVWLLVVVRLRHVVVVAVDGMVQTLVVIIILILISVVGQVAIVSVFVAVQGGRVDVVGATIDGLHVTEEGLLIWRVKLCVVMLGMLHKLVGLGVADMRAEQLQLQVFLVVIYVTI